APLPRRLGSGHSPVPEPGGGAGVRAAAGGRLPGDDRELQRLVAGPGLGTVPAPRPGTPARPLAQARTGPAAAAGGPDRGGPGPPPLPGGLAAGPEGPASGAAGLPATGQRCGRSDAAGTDL